MDYKSTLNLPKTSFSMKANLPVKEEAILKEWEAKGLYSLVRKKRKGSRKFVLHDGPPYANGDIHMGHALNKILKDIVVRFNTMLGMDSPYVPGWDCHGLPVEHQLFKELKMGPDDIDQVEFRKKAFDYAMKYVGIQKAQFKRLGVSGDWENPYLTLSKRYEAGIVRSFGRLVEGGYIYKGLKPVNWCSTCETALAEAEVEYRDKKSPSIFVRFELRPSSTEKKKASLGLPADGRIYFVIWTTTPWTLLSNVAVALHPDQDYVLLSAGDKGSGGGYLIMAKALADSALGKIGIKCCKAVKHFKGRELEGLECDHPFIDRASRVVLGDFVSMMEGAGCVHIAPGHGQEDYQVGRKYSLQTIMPVDPKGRFDETCGEFSGQDIYKANKNIIEKMNADGSLLFDEEVSHSYPHCWRCKKPIIFRATEQYFMNVDHRDLRKNVMSAIRSDIRWVPEQGVERIASMVENRPDWCLSRQRYWGVPIIAFKCASCKGVVLDSGIVEHVASIVEREGSDAWFARSAKELLPEGAKCPHCSSSGLEKESDIIDVWFESGVSSQAVLKVSKELDYPCEMYLEGSDQHRGWFQSSLIPAMAIDSKSPYRIVLTHGFVVDGEGKKMSKSLGNVISPLDIMKKYGADILRLWVASSDYSEDVRISDVILTRLADAYRKIRNTYRYLLSNLYDFAPEKNSVKHEDLLEIDAWILSRLSKLVSDVTGYYRDFAFHRVYREVYDFCVYEISSVYLDILKDRMYTFRTDCLERRSGQTAAFNVLRTLLKLMAPLLVFTADEAWRHLNTPEKEESIHLEDWPDEAECAGWRNEPLEEKWFKILKLRECVMKSLEEERKIGRIGSPLEAMVILSTGDSKYMGFLKENISILPSVFIVSLVELEEAAKGAKPPDQGIPVVVRIDTAKGEKCQRCWNYSETVGKDKEHQTICSRCIEAIKN
ncbi:isoleucine--tRNA ligase [Candidatus Omnitrophota bacterium]